MAISKRIRDMLASSIHELVAKVDDPEVALDDVIREMDRSISDLRREAASAIATQVVLAKRTERLRSEAARLETVAEMAVRKEDDVLARQALGKRRDLEAGVRTLAEQARSQDVLVAELRAHLASMQERAQEARLKRNTLLAKKRAAASRQKLAECLQRSTLASAGATDFARRLIGDYDSFVGVTAAVEASEAAAEARQEVAREGSQWADAEAAGRRLQRDDEIERDIARIKSKLGS
jgi:phage shock protein A